MKEGFFAIFQIASTCAFLTEPTQHIKISTLTSHNQNQNNQIISKMKDGCLDRNFNKDPIVFARYLFNSFLRRSINSL